MSLNHSAIGRLCTLPISLDDHKEIFKEYTSILKELLEPQNLLNIHLHNFLNFRIVENLDLRNQPSKSELCEFNNNLNFNIFIYYFITYIYINIYIIHYIIYI